MGYLVAFILGALAGSFVTALFAIKFVKLMQARINEIAEGLRASADRMS
jgi:hypothetical protein